MIEVVVDGHTIFQMNSQNDTAHLLFKVDQLTKAAKAMDELRGQHLMEIATLRDERDAAKIDAARMREALKQMTDMMECGDEPGMNSPWYRLARAALEGGK